MRYITKLLDSCSYLLSQAVDINFRKVESDTFADNLKLIDSNFDEVLAKMLLLSYIKNEKDIKKLISMIVKEEKEKEVFYQKNMTEFANAATFGMFAGKKWNGKNEVDGGIFVVTKDVDVFLLDLVYYKKHVDKYLIDNIKLESPSSTRYEMFQVYKEGAKYFLKLNLQVRFK